MRKHETAVCGTARTGVWEVGKCENRRQMPFMISIYLLPDYNIYIVMKKLCFLAGTICALLSLNSCNSCSSSKDGKSREEKIEEFRSELNKEDTAIMLKLCDDAMEELKNKNYDKVLASLYEYTDSTQELKPLSKEVANKYRRKFMLFPVLDYHRIYYSFQL